MAENRAGDQVSHIELIGPPGTGKSTIYQHLARRWRPAFNWTLLDAMGYHKPDTVLHPVSFSYLWNRTRKGKSIRRTSDMAMRFIKEQNEITRISWEIIDQHAHKIRDYDIRIRVAVHTFNRFGKMQFILEHGNGKPCLVDEGLLQRRFMLPEGTMIPEAEIRAYMNAVPAPAAVVALSCDDPEMLMQRIVRRGKKGSNSVKSNFDDRDLDRIRGQIVGFRKWTELTCSIMEERDIPVFRLDARESLESNAAKILSFLETPQTSHPG